ncbi:MAG TPA: replication-relaxation family protein [Terracidiphilus sp.]|nr:replication-relaxation family protein [Terracidiphilus sp.]HEV2396099.1 replication-relaxation family protein [Candidatus Sulfotelmatobacter sp.]
MRYYKGYIALSDTCDVPLLVHIRNARAVCFDQLRELLEHSMLAPITRSLHWRVARLEKAGLVARLNRKHYLGKPVFGITQQGLECLELRGHSLLSLPSGTERILDPSQILHALELVSIRLAFARAGLLRSWKGELEIASRNLVAADAALKDYDAIAEIEVDGCARKIGIEYEKSAKSAARYQAIRRALEDDDVSDVVLYVSPSDDILYLLAMELSPARKRLGFVLSETFHSLFLDARTLTNSNGTEVVPLRALFEARSVCDPSFD